MLAEQPDNVDKRRTNLIKMQGEFNTNLRQLEKRLLQSAERVCNSILGAMTMSFRTLETHSERSRSHLTKSCRNRGHGRSQAHHTKVRAHCQLHLQFTIFPATWNPAASPQSRIPFLSTRYFIEHLQVPCFIPQRPLDRQDQPRNGAK